MKKSEALEEIAELLYGIDMPKDIEELAGLVLFAAKSIGMSPPPYKFASFSPYDKLRQWEPESE